MNRRLMSTQWMEFQKSITAMADDSSPREILDAVLNWLKKYPQVFLGEPFSVYGFQRFLVLEAAYYPVEMSSMHDVEFKHFKKIIKEFSAKDTERIAMYLRDTLERLVVIEVERQCSRCECWGMGAYKNSEDGRIAFECRHCGLASYIDGSRVSASVLTFASSDDLRSAGLI